MIKLGHIETRKEMDAAHMRTGGMRLAGDGGASAECGAAAPGDATLRILEERASDSLLDVTFVCGVMRDASYKKALHLSRRVFLMVALASGIIKGVYGCCFGQQNLMEGSLAH